MEISMEKYRHIFRISKVVIAINLIIMDRSAFNAKFQIISTSKH